MKALVVLALLVSVSAQAKECTSDYVCGYSEKCLKDQWSYKGVCGIIVNQYGAQQNYGYQHSTESIGVKTDHEGMCQFDYQCGIGKCEKRPGAVYGYCVRR